MVESSCDVAVIGAGPAGSVAAALLSRKGYKVVVLEREVFPRFSIGESLLPQCMIFLEEAGMIDAVDAAGFQVKDGAAFHRRGRDFAFDFSDKSTAGRSTTFQVQRARFDALLADEAAKAGASIHYAHRIEDVDAEGDKPVLSYRDPEGRPGRLEARFCLDASGFARRLAQSQALDRQHDFPVRDAVFSHVVDHAAPARFDRNKILITVHPDHADIWFWMIPFSNGDSSVGVVGAKEHFAGYAGDEREILRTHVAEADMLGGALRGAEYDRPGRRLTGYASASSRSYGRWFALLGNAGGFLDPIFSSGVTIAMKSASLAANLLDRSFRGRPVDWERDFAAPLGRGVECFRHFVSAWYDGRLQDIIFAERTEPRIQRMICSVLAGYAWDEENPFVARPGARLTALAEACRRP